MLGRILISVHDSACVFAPDSGPGGAFRGSLLRPVVAFAIPELSALSTVSCTLGMGPLAGDEELPFLEQPRGRARMRRTSAISGGCRRGERFTCTALPLRCGFVPTFEDLALSRSGVVRRPA